LYLLSRDKLNKKTSETKREDPEDFFNDKDFDFTASTNTTNNYTNKNNQNNSTGNTYDITDVNFNPNIKRFKDIDEFDNQYDSEDEEYVNDQKFDKNNVFTNLTSELKNNTNVVTNNNNNDFFNLFDNITTTPNKTNNTNNVFLLFLL